MSLPDELAGLLEAQAYPHDCGAIELVETHISWVILTGELVYKVKKPVKFGFVDFSTLALREHFCREELRCNRRFAPALYLDVVPVGRGSDRRLRVGHPDEDEEDEIVDWAVKMRQFPQQAQLDRVLARDELTPDLLSRFGTTLAAQHDGLPVHRGDRAELDERVLAPAEDNYHDVLQLEWAADCRGVLERGREASRRQVARHRELLATRLASGYLRECHGDLHLSNLVLLEGGVSAFDCLEFNPTLRWIDPMSDVAFLFMDCLVRGRGDLGYAFLDGYLDAAGDYEGATLLPFYAAYRSMVRAKVNALRREQAEPADRARLEQRFRDHVHWASGWLERSPGTLVLTCGLSGSGKSFLARRLAPRLPAMRLRSDVARKVRAGLHPTQSAAAEVGAGLYDARHVADVYDWLLAQSGDLLRSGEHVIVDATFLDADQRGRFLALADEAGGTAVILHCDAPDEVLEARVGARRDAGDDSSDAGLTVLEHQRRRFEVPRERAVRVDTREPLDDTALSGLAQRLAGPVREIP